MSDAIFAQADAASQPLFATWGWIALAVLIVALLAFATARSPGRRFAALLLAVLAGVVALGGILSSARFRAGLETMARPALSLLRPLASNPVTWAVVLGAIALLLMLPRGTARMRALGAVIGAISLGCFAAASPLRLMVGERLLFWALALLTIGSAAATISMRSAVYSAIWFALSLLGTAALFFYQGAQFLGVATVVVYAGAIVVTFLFVVMLAQPEGHDVYDRISWGWFPKLFSVLTAAAFVVVLTVLIARPPGQQLRWKVARVLPRLVDEDGRRLLRDDQLVAADWTEVDPRRRLTLTLRGDLPATHLDELQQRLPAALAAADNEFRAIDVDPVFLDPREDVLHGQHMAHLGSELFSRHLVAVEAAGSVLLAALVGAVAIVSHGQRRRSPTTRGGRDTQSTVEGGGPWA